VASPVGEQPAPPFSAYLKYLVGVAGLGLSLTILWLSMRAVMEIGGFCASGGPYVIAVPCPDAVVAFMPLSVFGLFIFGGLVAWGGAAIPGGWAGLVFLAWPALFLSLGWNFVEFGLAPPGAEAGEVSWSWLFCGVIFGLMGGVPLVGAIVGVSKLDTGGRSYAGGRVIVARRGSISGGSFPSAAPAPREGGADMAERLERLARLHRASDLTAAEFEAAKRATLEDAG
jgi:hypothetical protein